MCFSNHSLCNKLLNHDDGIFDIPNLQPNNAPAIAPFVSASPPYSE